MTENVDYLNYLVRTYDGVTKLITQTKQRHATLSGEVVDDPENDDILKGDRHSEGLDTVKGRMSRDIEKELSANWDIWRLWLKMALIRMWRLISRRWAPISPMSWW